MADLSGGVWRTIAGRHIFIRSGESLSSAMKKSGKFKSGVNNKKKISSEKYNKKLDTEYNNLKSGKIDTEKYLKKTSKIMDKYTTDRIERGKLERTKAKVITKQESKASGNNLSEKLKNEGYKEQLDLKGKGTGFFKKGNSVIDSKTGKEYGNEKSANKNEFTREELKAKYGTDNTDIINAGKEKGDRVSLKSEEANTNKKTLYWNGGSEKIGENRIKRYGDDYMALDKYGSTKGQFKTYEEAEKFIKSGFENKSTKASGNSNEKSTSDIMNEKIRSRGKTKDVDNLPKKVEIKEQGTSNRKEVSENIQAHILEYYDSPDDFIQQMDAMDYLPTKWKAGEEIARGGSYLIYNQDMSDFLNDLKINPKGKSFSDEKAFNTYTSLIGRESAKLYTRLQRNAYNKYKKEHPLTQMSFEDFQNMNKK